MKKSKCLECHRKQVFFPKRKGTPSLVKIEHKSTANLDSARSKKSKVAVLQLDQVDIYLLGKRRELIITWIKEGENKFKRTFLIARVTSLTPEVDLFRNKQ